MQNRGFTLIEVLVALTILMVATLSIAHLFIVTATGIHIARVQTTTVALSASRMEELCSLAWGFDAAGNPVTDGSTNLSVEPVRSDGTGLGLSPANALQQNTAGFVDFHDGGGRWLSDGPAVPADAVYVRRWSIEAPAGGSPDALVIQVLTRSVAEENASGGGLVAMSRGEARLMTLLTRVAP